MGSATTPKKSPPASDWMVRKKMKRRGVCVSSAVEQAAETADAVKCLGCVLCAMLILLRAGTAVLFSEHVRVCSCVSSCVKPIEWMTIGGQSLTAAE